MNSSISNAAAALGSIGGSKKSEAKSAAARENGRKGGRPVKPVGGIYRTARGWVLEFPAPAGVMDGLATVDVARRRARDAGLKPERWPNCDQP